MPAAGVANDPNHVQLTSILICLVTAEKIFLTNKTIAAIGETFSLLLRTL